MKTKSLLVFIVACILWTATNAQATDWHVAKAAQGGSLSNNCTAMQSVSTPGLTIAQGLACLSANPVGNRLLIRAGTYDEIINTRPSDGTTLLGATSFSNGPIIQGYPGDARPVIRGNGNTFVVNLAGGTNNDGSSNGAVGAPWVILKDVVIDCEHNSFRCSGEPVSITGPARLDNVEAMRPQGNSYLAGGNNTHIISSAGRGVQILNSQIHRTSPLTASCPANGPSEQGCGMYGIYHTGSFAIIRNNDFYDLGGYWLHHFNSGQTNVSDNVIDGNRSHDVGYRGRGSSAPYQVVITSGARNFFINNIVRDSSQANGPIGGIEVDSPCTNCVVANNLVRNNAGAAMTISASNGQFSGTLAIRNNTFDGNGSLFALSGTPSFAADHNLCFNTGQPCADYIAGGIVGTGTSLNADPRLANPAKLDYRPCTDVGAPDASCAGASPLIGAGVNLSNLFTTDAAGTPRGTSWSIGPFQGGTAPPTGPTVSINSPTTAASYTSNTNTIALSGSSSSGVAVSKVTWACPTCTPTSGTASGTTNWSIASITLALGSNVITVTVTDNNGQTATDVLTVNYIAAGLVAAYGLEESSGTSVIDSSGNSNNGNIGAGVTRVTGVTGRGLFFDGTGVLVVPDSDSLDLTGAMTISMYVSPIELSTTWRALVTKYPGFWLYATAGDGACPNNNKVYGGFEEASADYVALCSNSVLTVNQWTFLTFKWDGVTEEIYFGTTLAGSRSATGTIPANTNDLRIGNSPFLEGFKGFIDRVRIYNYAVPLTAGNNTCADVPSITRDMNCRINNATITVNLKVSTLKTGPGRTRSWGPPL